MENMVALVIFSIVIIFLYQMLFSGRLLVETGGERRMALKLAELKMEELMYAGYGSQGADADWTSLNMTVGNHPTNDPSVLMDDRGTADTQDDLIGNMTWTVADTTWPSGGVTTRCKILRVSVEWPRIGPRDHVWLATLVSQ
jgi:hypothetical protein